jgi:Carboxypeptidase regulatory-like domain
MGTALFLFGLIPAALVPSLALAQVSDPAPATIEGQVVSATTGQPLRKAKVELFHRGATPFDLDVASGISDDGGRFKLDNLAPGKYGLSGSRTGYVSESRFNTRSQTIKLGPGQHLSDILIKLTPQGIVAGSVLDEDGDPIPYVQVILYRERGSRTQMRPDQASNADAEGHFVLTGLTPGRYYVAAYQFQQRTLNREPQESYVLTYYPDSLDAATAVALDILPGTELRSVEIRLRKARTFRISGKVVNWPADSRAFTLSLIRVGGSLMEPACVQSEPTGTGLSSSQISDPISTGWALPNCGRKCISNPSAQEGRRSRHLCSTSRRATQVRFRFYCRRKPRTFAEQFGMRKASPSPPSASSCGARVIGRRFLEPATRTGHLR